MKLRSNTKQVLYLAGLVLIPLLSKGAFAASGNLRPTWGMGAMDLADHNNSSYLSDLRPNVVQHPTFFGSLLDLRGVNADPKATAALRQSYEDQVRDYELRRNYSLLQPWEEEQHKKNMEELARHVRVEVQQLQIRRARKNMLAAAERDKDLQALGIAAGIAGAVTGQPVEVKMSDRTRLIARTDLPSERGEVQFFSPTVNASVNVVAKAPSWRDPNAAPSDDPLQREERYRLSLSRELPVLDLGAGLQYRGTSSDLTASLSKPLSPNLTAVFDTVRPMDPRTAAARGNEEVIRFLYGINF